jgi:hypothetical protein
MRYIFTVRVKAHNYALKILVRAIKCIIMADRNPQLSVPGVIGYF